MLVFTVSIVTNNSLEIDYSQGHYIKISSIMHGTHFLPFTSNQTPLGKLDYLIAECAFESNPYFSWEYKSEYVSWDRAEEIIQKFIDTDGTCFEDR